MPKTDSPLDWGTRYAGRMAGMKASEIRELLKLLDQPDIISFAGGIPDPALFPQEEIANVYAQICGDRKVFDAAFQYSVSEGDAGLRRWIVGYMAKRGVTCDMDNILITCGSQQGLEFLGRMFLSAGDTALVEAPTYLGALQAFSAMEPVYDTLPTGQSNRTVASYRDNAAAAGGTAKFAYLVPDFANPTGRTLSVAEREELLSFARDLDIPVIEDSPYVALRYDGVDVAMIQALDCAATGSIEASRVISLGSFSKVFTPGLRVGWICAPKAVIAKLTLMKQASDLSSSAINQRVIATLAEARFDRQVAQGVEHYRVKRDAMLAALDTHMPKGVQWTKAEGGLFVWVTLPDHLDATALLQDAIEQARVAYVPGHAFFADGSGRNTLRLSFSLPSVQMIEQGIAKLGALVAQAL
ncbi:PLP-dependent aminotransferase family protein [Roseobacter sp. N2S]|uniref:aminotransferase-like domain-containing protein n=1 Tax=Roseobacter sp. N2S TaxID=2663844 RepID=UPI0028651E4C|nr:PLP-dependent aminotransferase family protein [Roseobacter sp. N2S]MDR6263484.1 DNA-binding transcriptional MocR family regulator [Roseobacter sp. N2S]